MKIHFNALVNKLYATCTHTIIHTRLGSIIWRSKDSAYLSTNVMTCSFYSTDIQHVHSYINKDATTQQMHSVRAFHTVAKNSKWKALPFSSIVYLKEPRCNTTLSWILFLFLFLRFAFIFVFGFFRFVMYFAQIPIYCI